MFAAQSTNWLAVKQDYDLGPNNIVISLSTPKDESEKVIQRAESGWCKWLAMEDWVLGYVRISDPEAKEGTRLSCTALPQDLIVWGEGRWG